MGGSKDDGEVTGAILAGGRARRFGGRNKATLTFDGRRIVDRQLEALRTATADQIIVASDAMGLPGVDVPVVADVVAGAGPLGGLLTALTVARHARVLVLACDLPFVHGPFLQFLVQRAPAADAVVPRTAAGPHPLCAVYSTRIHAIVATRIAARRLAVHELFDRVATTFVLPEEMAPFDPAGRLLANINSQAEYEAAQLAFPRQDAAPSDEPR
jgi:molybdopterin-guanine dinucleotide biosynthesis protein A